MFLKSLQMYKIDSFFQFEKKASFPHFQMFSIFSKNKRSKMKKPHFLISHEDYWSIWIGGFVLLVGLVLFFRNAPEDYVTQHEKYETLQAAEKCKSSI